MSFQEYQKNGVRTFLYPSYLVVFFYYNVYYGGNNDWTDNENGAPGLAPCVRLRVAIGRTIKVIARWVMGVKHFRRGG
jgi:hypothetical protein